MNSGFNLRTALHVAKRELLTGHQYIVVGDGATTICQSRSGIAAVIDIEPDGSALDFTMSAYPNGPYGVGTMYSPTIDDVSENYAVPTDARIREISSERLTDLLQLETVPVFYDDELYWSDELLPL
jgi:hypothetical protein